MNRHLPEPGGRARAWGDGRSFHALGPSDFPLRFGAKPIVNSPIRISIARVPGTDDLPLPRRFSQTAAGYDLTAAVQEPVVLPPGGFGLVPTGIRIALPQGFEAQVRPRSGLAARYGVGLLNSPGTIDSDYRGEVSVILFNFGREPFVVRRGDRIAQMIVARVETVEWEAVETLEATERGEGGFGHTGR